jgi:hypothetical protein
MNEITKVYDYVINLFNLNELVDTISIVPTIEMDNNKENIYPLVNADLTATAIEDNIIICDFEITIVQQRNTTTIKTDSKLLNDTNYLDNMNETHSIASRFINVVSEQNNDDNIELDSISKLKPLKNWSRNSLDGFQFNVSLSIPNSGKSC